MAVSDLIVPLLGLAIMVAMIVGTWKAFTKAGEPGWAVFIPIYNYWVMLRIGDNDEVLNLVLMFIPIIQLYAFWIMFKGVADAFGQGTGFSLGLWFLGFIFWPMLGFGDYQYQGAPA
jgi:hypothetical protein